jgi:hypothetical protein
MTGTRYSNSGDRLTAMPWTRDQFSDDELRQWLASRKEAARKIDITTCEIGAWYHSMNDEYGIREMLGEQTEEQLGYSDKSNFVRLTAAFAEAEAKARELGLITTDDDGGAQ